MIKIQDFLKKITFYLTNSVRKKITAIIILPFVLSLILVMVGTYIIHVENVILVVVRLEREWLDLNLNGFKYFNKYIITGDRAVLDLSLRNLEGGYRINKIGPHIKAVSKGEEINKKELARQTSQATEQIGAQIETMRTDTKSSVTAISEISKTSPRKSMTANDKNRVLIKFNTLIFKLERI